MNTAFLCISIVFLVHREGSRAANYEEFQPRPIPINDWDSSRYEEKAAAGSLQEAVALGAPKTATREPSHYWEGALRHSVYLTLVRDKIDQLIAKGLVVAPDSEPDTHTSKHVDDHNLWEKIKTAPFDRLIPEEPPLVYHDITILAKGRLLEENHGYRFTQDKFSKEKCNEESCMDGIKAYWSVKRVRQRDAEKNPGKYYELTFSIMSHNLQNEKKPYENPVRTFTVRESNAAEQPKPITEPTRYVPRPQRALWFHKNLTPQSNQYSRKTYQPPILDRLFLSIFSDDEPEPHYRYKPPHQPQVIQPSKVGHGPPIDNQKKIEPYRYTKPHNTRYNNRVPPPLTLNFPPTPPLSQPPLQQETTELDKYTSVRVHQPTEDKQISKLDNQFPQSTEQKQTSEVVNIYTAIPDQVRKTSEVTHKLTDQKQTTMYDNKYTSFQLGQKNTHEHDKLTRQSELKHASEYNKGYSPPTDNKQFSEFDTKYTRQPDTKYFSPSPVQHPYLNVTMPAIHRPNVSEPTTREPEIITYNYSKTKPKHHMTKYSHFPEHIRPPVFNAPPGVFVTMDKKPFKPMPPLKLPFLKKHMANRKPTDFRPSPQVLDVQFSEPDPLSDSFRPITVNYADSYTTEISDIAVPVRNLTKTKPKNKHDNIKTHRTTTQAPEIITAQNNLSIEKMTLESMNWATNMLGTYSKTTPMLSEILGEVSDSTPEPSTTTSTTDDSWLLTTEPRTVSTTTTSTTTSTTEAPKRKRTRPPAKFGSADKPAHVKVKTYKRVTTANATSNITSTTPPPTTTAKPHSRRTIPDSLSQTTNKMEELQQSDTTTTTTSSEPTTVTTTTSTTTTTTTTTTPWPVTTGTTRTTTATPTTTTTVPTTTQNKRNNRYRHSTLMYKGTSVKHDKWVASNLNLDKTKTVIPLNKSQHNRRKSSNFHGYVSSTPKTVEEERRKEDHVDLTPDSMFNEIGIKSLSDTSTAAETPPHKTDEAQHNETKEQENFNENIIQDSKDNKEYIFNVLNSNFNDNDLSDPELITVTTLSMTTTPQSPSTNKTKCKKNKSYSTTTETLSRELETEVLTTQAPAVSDIFDEIFGFTANDNSEMYNMTDSTYLTSASSNNENFYSPPLEEWLKSLTSDDNVVPYLDDANHEKELEVEGRREKKATSSEESEEDDYDSGQDNGSNEDDSRTSRHPDLPEEPREYSVLELLAMD